MVKKLIINADDFGETEGITNGIIDCHRDGVLTSTTLLVNMPFTEYAISRAARYPQLGVGIHLNITMGKPITAVKTFVDENNEFVKVHNYKDRFVEVDTQELETEWTAQIERFIELVGKKPTHLDSHHHVHMSPSHHAVVERLAKKYDVPVRQVPMDNVARIQTGYEDVAFKGDFFGDTATYENILSGVNQDVDVLEIMCHPAYLDQLTYETSGYHLERMKEMEILRSHQLKMYIQVNNVELINYSHLVKQ